MLLRHDTHLCQKENWHRIDAPVPKRWWRRIYAPVPTIESYAKMAPDLCTRELIGTGFRYPCQKKKLILAPDLCTRALVAAACQIYAPASWSLPNRVECSDDVGLGSLSGGRAAGGPARAAPVPSDHQPTGTPPPFDAAGTGFTYPCPFGIDCLLDLCTRKHVSATDTHQDLST